MADRREVYFVSDVHLGPGGGGFAEREAEFVAFLRSIPAESTRALYLLGDIWDFWFEYRSVVPKGYVRSFAALSDLIDAGVELVFVPGNHDLWPLGYLEEMGIKIMRQPFEVVLDGSVFCLGHGDFLGKVPFRDWLVGTIFRSKVLRALFSAVHPTPAYALARAWSQSNKEGRGEYQFAGEREPLYGWAAEYSRSRKVDYFVFGHYHCKVDMTLPSGARLVVGESWEKGAHFFRWDGQELSYK